MKYFTKLVKGLNYLLCLLVSEEYELVKAKGQYVIRIKTKFLTMTVDTQEFKVKEIATEE